MFGKKNSSQTLSVNSDLKEETLSGMDFQIETMQGDLNDPRKYIKNLPQQKNDTAIKDLTPSPFLENQKLREILPETKNLPETSFKKTEFIPFENNNKIRGNIVNMSNVKYFNDTLEPRKEDTSSSNMLTSPVINMPKNPKSIGFLVATILISFVVTLGAGAYYYLIVLPKTNTQIQEEPNSITKEKSLPELENKTIGTNANEKKPIIETKIDSTLPEKLSSAKEIALTGNSLSTFLINILKDVPKIENGFYTISNQSKRVDSTIFLSEMNILEPKLNRVLIKDAWLFLSQEKDNSRRLGFIFKVNSAEETRKVMLEIETKLPDKISPFFFPPLKNNNSQIVFKANTENSNVRFFNYLTSQDTHSLDWSVLEVAPDKTFLILATSRDNIKEAIAKIKN